MTRKIPQPNPNQKTLNPSNGKYETYLMEVMEQLSHEIPDHMDIIERIELATNAWNMASVYRTFSKEPTYEMVQESQFSEAQQKIMHKMVDYILRQWPEDTLFLGNLKVLQHGETIRIHVDTIAKEQFIANAMAFRFEKERENDFQKYMEKEFERQMERDFERRMEREFEEDLFDFEFQEGFVNRAAIRIQPLQPYLDWAKIADPKFIEYLDPGKKNFNIYLVEADDVQKWLTKHFDTIFEQELGYIDIDGDYWPTKRTYDMFQKWFSVEISSLLYDLSETPLRKGF